VTSDGDTALTPVFWLVLVATGVAAGLFGAGLMYLLFTVEHKHTCGFWPRQRQGANGPRRRVTMRSVPAQTA
jgi:hypothetical protein